MLCDPCSKGDHCGKPGEVNRRCPCQHRPPGTGQDPARLAAVAAARASRVSDVHLPLAYVETGRTADPDLYVSPGFNQTVQDVPVTELLAYWMRAVRAGQHTRAGVLHGALADRIARLT